MVVDTDRQTGRTQFMIDQVVESVLDGQSLCRVVVHNVGFIKHVRERLLHSLLSHGCDVVVNNRLGMIVNDYCKILFHTIDTIDNDVRGAEIYDCQFWDHHALEMSGRAEYQCEYVGKNN
jgi:hypothetical protein